MKIKIIRSVIVDGVVIPTGAVIEVDANVGAEIVVSNFAIVADGAVEDAKVSVELSEKAVSGQEAVSDLPLAVGEDAEVKVGKKKLGK